MLMLLMMCLQRLLLQQTPTGKAIATTIPGYYVQNKSIEVSIKNQAFTAYYNENGSHVWLYYKIAVKGHFANWTYENWYSGAITFKTYESNPGYLPGSGSDNTVSAYGLVGNNGTGTNPFSLLNVSVGGQVDFTIQAIIGYSTRFNESFSGPPIGLDPGESYHYFIFTGESSEWSNTKTITIPDGVVSISTAPQSTEILVPTITPTPALTLTSTPTPSDTNINSITLPFNTFIGIIAVLAVAIVALSLLLLRRSRKTNNMKQ